MRRAVDEFEQLLDRSPHRHVDEKIRVGGREDFGGVAVVALEAPQKAGRGLGQRVDAVERIHEIRQDRIVGWCHDPPHIELRYVPICLCHRTALALIAPSNQNMRPLGAICQHLRTVVLTL
jgi:hypothetical protein